MRMVQGLDQILAIRLIHRLTGALILALSLSACGKPAPDATERMDGGQSPSSRAAAHPVFSDQDPHDGVGNMPSRYPVHGVDVSRWQGDVDWRQARGAGISFAFIKATEGGDLLDPKFRTYWADAKAAGVRRGAYHFFYFCRPAEEQARWFIENVPKDPKALPPVLDMEWNPHSPTCTRRPPRAEVLSEARLFLDRLERHYGRRPVVYTTVDFYSDTGIGQIAGTEFWLRSVASHPTETYPGMHWTFWQYTGTGIVPGFSTPVDINVFAGNADQWVRWVR
jgi:lysozyme